MILNLFGRRHIKGLSDSELVKLVQRDRSKPAMGEIYSRYSMMLFGVGLKYMKNKMDAEDILMQTFEKLPDKIERSTIKNLKNWIYTVIKNECLMQLRKKNILDSEIDQALLFTKDDSASEFEEIQIKDTRLTLLEDAIKQLKDEQKVCIELFYLKQNCYESIAQNTGFELKKVKSYIQNGKRNLKLILDRQDAFK